jgi:hypothetical protein
VIAVLKHDDAVPLLSRVEPIAQSHLQGHFDTGRSAVRKKYMLKSRRSQADKFSSDPLGGIVGIFCEDDLIQDLSLRLDGVEDALPPSRCE